MIWLAQVVVLVLFVLHFTFFSLVGGLNVDDFFSHLHLFRYSQCSFLSIHPSVQFLLSGDQESRLGFPRSKWVVPVRCDENQSSFFAFFLSFSSLSLKRWQSITDGFS